MISENEIINAMRKISEKKRTREGLHPLNKILKDEASVRGISQACMNGRYNFSPFSEKLFLRGKKKYPREISIPTYTDQAILKCLDGSLKEFCEINNKTELASFLVKDVKSFLTPCPANMLAIRLDIVGYFDNINHHILLQKIKDKNCPEWLFELTKRAIKTPTKTKYTKEKKKRTKGIAQGISIASHLADLYLEDFDSKYTQKCIKYFRYVDDILLFVSPSNKDKILDSIEASLTDLGLAYHRDGDKFQVTQLNDIKGFCYLGYHFYPHKNQISVRYSSIQNYINSVIAIITKFRRRVELRQIKNIETEKRLFIYDLNEKITGAIKGDKRYGWLWYFKELTDLGLLNHIDKIINRELLKSEITRDIKPKKLKRTHYEILHQGKNSKYILNYGTEDITIMRKILTETGHQTSNLDEAHLRSLFFMVVNRRIRKLVLDEVRES